MTTESKRLREANKEKESLIKDLQKKLHSCGNNKNQVCGHIQQIVEGNKKFDTFDITRGANIFWKRLSRRSTMWPSFQFREKLINRE